MTRQAILERLAAALAQLNGAIGSAGRTLAGGFLAAMTVVILLQVVSRYVFNNSLSWTEELSKSLMVWTAFLVAPSAYRTGAHVSIDTFILAVPARMQASIRLLITGLILWILGVFLVESISFVARGLNSRMATLPIPTGAFYIVMPASLVAMILVGIEQAFRQVVDLVSARPVSSSEPAAREG